MKKILIVSAVFPPEPVVTANSVFDIVLALKSDFEVTVLSPKPTRPFGYNFSKNYTIFNGFKHIQINSFTCPQSKIFGRFRESYSFGRAVSTYIKKHSREIDLIYAVPWPIFSQYQIIRIAKHFNIKVIMQVTDIYPEALSGKIFNFFYWPIKKTLLYLDRISLMRCSAVTVLSPYMKEYLAASRCLPEDHFILARSWQNDDLYLNYVSHNKRSETNSIFTFMYAGSISRSAGVDLVIRSFQRANISNARLIIAGSGACKDECVKLAADLNGSNIFFENMTPETVPDVQNEADVLLLPLKKGIAKTAMPSKMVAYCFSRKPIIASLDVDSDAADCIGKGEYGYVVSPENEAELAEAMREIKKLSVNARKRMGENAFKFAQENLSKKKNLGIIVNMIRNCLK